MQIVVYRLQKLLVNNGVVCVIIQQPPSSTRTNNLFPYTTLFRSRRKRCRHSARNALHDRMEERLATMALLGGRDMDIDFMADAEGVGSKQLVMLPDRDEPVELHWGIQSNNREVAQIGLLRSETARIERPGSEARRVGKEWVRTVRPRWSPTH